MKRDTHYNVIGPVVQRLRKQRGWSQAKLARFPNLKPSTKSISLRLPLDLLERIKVEANRRDVPYQSLIKVWLDEKAS